MDNKLLELCEQKVKKEISLTWDYIAQKNGYSKGESLRCAYKAYRKNLGLLPSRNDNISADIEEQLEELDLQKIELKKEKVRLQDQRTAFNKKIRETARYENIIEEITKAIKESNLAELKIHRTNRIFMNDSDHEMVVCFSDFHYGLFVRNHWNEFDSNIFVERLTKYIGKVIEIGRQFGVRRIVVMNLGDVVSGNIHVSLRVANAEDIIKQTQDVAEYIGLALHALSQEFDVVDYYSATGNHGRVTASKEDSITGENFEHLISWYLKARLKGVTNVTIHDNKIDKDIIVAKVKGHTIFGSHGDKDKIANVVQNLTMMVGEIPTSCFLGHLHHYAEDTIQGVNVIMSGSLIGTDDYARDIRRIGNACQTLCIYDKHGKVCSFNIVLN